MKQLKGFVVNGKEHMGCRLKKSIYGLKQASRQWNLKFDDTIKRFGFEPNIEDNCVYAKLKNGKYVFLILYVDDILLASNGVSLLRETKKFLSSNFDMKDLGEASYVLGIEIHRDRKNGVLGLSQKAYLEKILKKYNMHTSKATPAPIVRACLGELRLRKNSSRVADPRNFTMEWLHRGAGILQNVWYSSRFRIISMTSMAHKSRQ
jgi:hypothetical protein